MSRALHLPVAVSAPFFWLPSRIFYNEFDRRQAVKRGGRVQMSSIDMAGAEHRYASEPAAAGTPDDRFNLRWALVLLDRGLHSTKLEYERAGNPPSSCDSSAW